MDGNFNGDEGFSFTYNRSNYGLPATTGASQTAFLMRLAPSVSNSVIGDLGVRDLINRAQLTLETLTVNVSAGRYLVTGILNPNNIDSANTVWSGLNNAGGGFQPSFTQFAVAPRYNNETTGGVQAAPLNTTGGFTRSGTMVLSGSVKNFFWLIIDQRVKFRISSQRDRAVECRTNHLCNQYHKYLSAKSWHRVRCGRHCEDSW
jgi:hypothetical protein